MTFVNNVSLYDWFEIYVVVSFELLQRQQKTVTPWTIPSAGIVKIKDTNEWSSLFLCITVGLNNNSGSLNELAKMIIRKNFKQHFVRGKKRDIESGTFFQY